MFEWANYRMPIDGLYLTGSTTHPGGLVSGFPGQLCAEAVLQDLGLDTSCVSQAVPIGSTAKRQIDTFDFQGAVAPTREVPGNPG